MCCESVRSTSTPTSTVEPSVKEIENPFDDEFWTSFSTPNLMTDAATPVPQPPLAQPAAVPLSHAASQLWKSFNTPNVLMEHCDETLASFVAAAPVPQPTVAQPAAVPRFIVMRPTVV
jgi:hypothetical protein